MQNKADMVLNWMELVENVISTIGLFVVFGYYHKQKKPIFIKIIWVFIMLEISNYITQIALDKHWDRR